MPATITKAATMILAMGLASVTHAAAAALPDNQALRQCLASGTASPDFSGVIAITRAGETLTHSQGQTAGPGSAAIAADQQFNLGSAGKMFTAVAIAQLFDAGKISLDDPIGRYLDGLAPATAAVKVRQLLTHSGGLGNFFTPDNLQAMQQARQLSDLKPLIADEKPAFTPGSRFEYSNSGFLLLGLLIEKLSGQSYGDYLQAKIFGPSGMTASSLVPAAEPKRAIGMTTMPEMPPMAGPDMPPPGVPGGPGIGAAGPMGPPPRGMGPPPAGFRPPAGPLRPAAEAALIGNSAGGSYSTAADMQRFFAALLAGKLTSAASRDLLLSPQITVVPAKEGVPARSHGLGIGLGTAFGHPWVGHNGGTVGVNVETMAFPDDQATIVVLANRDPPVAGAVARRVEAMLFDGESCKPKTVG